MTLEKALETMGDAGNTLVIRRNNGITTITGDALQLLDAQRHLARYGITAEMSRNWDFLTVKES